MIAIKFGGISISNADKIKHIANLIEGLFCKKPIVVISAIGNTTDDLIKAGEDAVKGIIDIQKMKEIHFDIISALNINSGPVEALFMEMQNLLMGLALTKELSKRLYDYLISFGERLAVRILAGFLLKSGIKSRYYDAWDLGLFTDSNYNNASILEESYINLRESLRDLDTNYDHIPVITGFIAKDKNGNITTLGRGGSDLTVSVIGSALNVEEIQVWKDVNGILTCDPKIIQNPLPISCISFEEASELAYFGAKILHPKSILPAMKSNIPVRVKSYIQPETSGTQIINDYKDENELLRAITYKKNVTVVDIVSTRMLGHYGFLANVFKILSDLKISVDVVATSEVSISFTLDYEENPENLKSELEKISNVNIHRGNTIISLIGNVHHSSEILSRTFSILNDMKINVRMLSLGASKVNISIIIDDENADICINELHKQFFEGERI